MWHLVKWTLSSYWFLMVRKWFQTRGEWSDHHKRNWANKQGCNPKEFLCLTTIIDTSHQRLLFFESATWALEWKGLVNMELYSIDQHRLERGWRWILVFDFTSILVFDFTSILVFDFTSICPLHFWDIGRTNNSIWIRPAEGIILIKSGVTHPKRIE